MPDTPANAAEFGYAGSGSNRSTYPKARMLAECGTHAFVAAEVDVYRVGEKTLLQRLCGRLRPDELLTADRGFYSWPAWGAAAAPGADARGRAVVFGSGEPTGLSTTLPAVLAQLRQVVGPAAPVLLGFDRGGSYPVTFAACRDAGAHWVTYRRAPWSRPPLSRGGRGRCATADGSPWCWPTRPCSSTGTDGASRLSLLKGWV